MNDFTKEELERILDGVTWWLDSDNALYSEALVNKLQSMIDNYRDQNCIHEIDRKAKKCKLCGLPSHSIPCVGGWL